MTSKLLQRRTTAAMFFPMSCTSPFTVARRNVPLRLPAILPASRLGRRISTARCMVRALFTTCGRNILPDSKSRPTYSIPAISGPSTTALAEPSLSMASVRSASRLVSSPLANACSSLFSTGMSAAPAVESVESGPVVSPENSCAWAISLSAASLRRHSMASSSNSSSCGGMASNVTLADGSMMAMDSPARMA